MGSRAEGVAASAVGYVGLKVFAGAVAIGEPTVADANSIGTGLLGGAGLVA